ncbi:hypothetical protein L6164_001157 [Bauhinia variegata]|uniref:Uncharacterized protein n=1 Tax=Bauhinia variegata TaxID=167791 RepID=A0ACB9Q8M8_BAUVA|nr:hypothetical protein L6164_001157 [Bauhinia variegata]
MEQVDYVGNPYSNTRNLEWRNHPNFSWKNSNTSVLNPANLSTLKTSSFEFYRLDNILTKTQEKYDSRVENNDSSIRNLDAYLRKLQSQVDQIVKLVSEKTPGTSTNNPLANAQEHAKAIIQGVRLFLATSRALVDVEMGKLTLRCGDEQVRYNILDDMKWKERKSTKPCFMMQNQRTKEKEEVGEQLPTIIPMLSEDSSKSSLENPQESKKVELVEEKIGESLVENGRLVMATTRALLEIPNGELILCFGSEIITFAMPFYNQIKEEPPDEVKQLSLHHPCKNEGASFSIFEAP